MYSGNESLSQKVVHDEGLRNTDLVLTEAASSSSTAHELAHALQQFQRPMSGTDNGAGLKISDPSERFEREAEANAALVMASPIDGGNGLGRAGQGKAPSASPIQRATLDVQRRLSSDSLLYVAKNVTTEDGTTSSQIGDNTELFKGESPDQRRYYMNQFQELINKAQKEGKVAERAAALASAIKATQYLRDGNTRTATAAVFAVYQDAGKRITALPLEVFAAVGERELNDKFDLAAWLRERESSQEESDADQAAIPSIAELEDIKGKMSLLAGADNQLTQLRSRWEQYKRQHPTEEEARAEYNQDSSCGATFEEAWDEHEFPSEGDRKDNFTKEFSEDDLTVWFDKDTIVKGYNLIKPGGSTKFAGTVRGKLPEGRTWDEALGMIVDLLYDHENMTSSAQDNP